MCTQATINFINTANAMEDFIEMHFYLRHRVLDWMVILYVASSPLFVFQIKPTKGFSSGDVIILALRDCLSLVSQQTHRCMVWSTISLLLLLHDYPLSRE